jgi:hypothetical protein
LKAIRKLVRKYFKNDNRRIPKDVTKFQNPEDLEVLDDPQPDGRMYFLEVETRQWPDTPLKMKMMMMMMMMMMIMMI